MAHWNSVTWSTRILESIFRLWDWSKGFSMLDVIALAIFIGWNTSSAAPTFCNCWDITRNLYSMTNPCKVKCLNAVDLKRGVCVGGIILLFSCIKLIWRKQLPFVIVGYHSWSGKQNQFFAYQSAFTTLVPITGPSCSHSNLQLLSKLRVFISFGPPLSLSLIYAFINTDAQSN